MQRWDVCPAGRPLPVIFHVRSRNCCSAVNTKSGKRALERARWMCKPPTLPRASCARSLRRSEVGPGRQRRRPQMCKNPGLSPATARGEDRSSVATTMSSLNGDSGMYIFIPGSDVLNVHPKNMVRQSVSLPVYRESARAALVRTPADVPGLGK